MKMPKQERTEFFGSLRFRYGLVIAGVFVVAGYFLWQEHAAHITGYLPLILLLGACFGMHFFMHGSHGHGKGDGSGGSGQPR